MCASTRRTPATSAASRASRSADGLLLTVDPSYQYVLANGGGSTTLAENSPRAKGANQTGPGIDFNGDGDIVDTIRFFTPNNTNTHRLGLTSSLIWDINPDHRVRVAYTYDRAHHRQTGEWGFLEADGDPESVFSGRNATPVLDATRLPDPAARPHLDRPSEPGCSAVDRQVLRTEAAPRGRRPPAVLQARSATPSARSRRRRFRLLHRRADPRPRHADRRQPGGRERLDPDFRQPGRSHPDGANAAQYNFALRAVQSAL